MMRTSTENLIKSSVAILAIAVTACAPRMYERSVVILDQSNLDDFTIKYGELEGCLLKQQVPLNYGVARPRYALALRAGMATDKTAPRIEVVIKGASELNARFAELKDQPEAGISDQGTRYSIDTAELKAGKLTIEVRRGEEVLGTEFFSFKQRSCSALSVGQ